MLQTPNERCDNERAADDKSKALNHQCEVCANLNHHR
jgi:hypothetical protein